MLTVKNLKEDIGVLYRSSDITNGHLESLEESNKKSFEEIRTEFGKYITNFNERLIKLEKKCIRTK